MKLMSRITMMIAAIIVISTQAANASLPYIGEDEAVDTTKYNVYTGKVIDADDRNPLPFATIESQGTSMATVTNIDGEFTLKIPKEINIKNIKVSYIGYKNKFVPIEKFLSKRNGIIKLETSTVNLSEIVIRPGDADALITEILRNIPKNYSKEDMMMTAFYRETIKRKRNYVSISEAVVDIFKGAYQNEFKYDQVKLIQGRKSADVEKMDTILFKIQGGPVTTLLLDIVKNPYIILTDAYKEVYNFNISDVISMNDKLHYVISFEQQQHVTIPYYRGKLYVEMENLAITEAEFSLNMTNKAEVANMFIKKKPLGMSVIPEKAVYRSKYTIQDDKWYFSYARAEVKFNVDWDKKLFNTSYSTMSEIAITSRTNEDVGKFANKERFKRSHVLDELVYVFFDLNFWGSYNVIEPDQTIESAIKRLNRKFEKTEPRP